MCPAETLCHKYKEQEVFPQQHTQTKMLVTVIDSGPFKCQQGFFCRSDAEMSKHCICQIYQLHLHK